MARPRKTGLDYFPFDVDFFDDEKIVAIAGEFGLKGEITAIKLLCAVYRNGYFAEWNEMLKMKMLRYLPGISSELLEQIVDRLVKWGFFDKTLFHSAKVLTSVGIQRRFFSASRKRIKTRENPYLLISASEMTVSAPETTHKHEFLPPETTQSKGNNIKETSTDVEEKKAPTSSIDDEITKLSQSDIWLDNLQVIYGMDKEQLRDKLQDFRRQCIADGKTSHSSLQDAKQHFNSWLRITTNKTKQNDNYKPRCQNKRRGNLLSSDGKKDYGNSF